MDSPSFCMAAHGTGTAKDFFMVDSKDLRGRTAVNIAEAAGLSLVVERAMVIFMAVQRMDRGYIMTIFMAI